MKVSSVVTVFVMIPGLLLVSGCAGQRKVYVQKRIPLQPAVTPIQLGVPIPVQTDVSFPVHADVSFPVHADAPGPILVTATATPLNAAAPLIPTLAMAAAHGKQNLQPVITEGPPPPQVEVVGSAPSPDYAWIPGRWQRDKGEWVWASGTWAITPHSQAVWVPGRWIHREANWVWIRGYWR